MFSLRMEMLILLVLPFSFFANVAMGLDAPSPSPTVGDIKIYIVFTLLPPQGIDEKGYAIKLLTSVLQSEKLAEEALIYVYTLSANGFAAKLTPDQAAKLEGQPGVVGVQENTIGHVHI